MKKYIIIFMLFLFSPKIEKGKVIFGNQVSAQTYSLEEVIIEGWDKTIDNIFETEYETGYVAEESQVTWTDPDDPTNSYTYYIVKIENDIFPTYQEPVYNGNAMWGSNFIGPGPDVDPFTTGLTPVDELDRAAMTHDYIYWKTGASGISGAFFDDGVKNADLVLLNAANNIINRYHSQDPMGKFDIVTGLPITEGTVLNAMLVKALFEEIVESKYGYEF